MQPQGTPQEPVVVIYDGANGERIVSKEFTKYYQARSLYMKKFKEGRNPLIKKASSLKGN